MLLIGFQFLGKLPDVAFPFGAFRVVHRVIERLNFLCRLVDGAFGFVKRQVQSRQGFVEFLDFLLDFFADSGVSVVSLPQFPQFPDKFRRFLPLFSVRFYGGFAVRVELFKFG